MRPAANAGPSFQAAHYVKVVAAGGQHDDWDVAVAALGDAVDAGLLPRNPAAKAKPPEIGRDVQPAVLPVARFGDVAVRSFSQEGRIPARLIR